MDTLQSKSEIPGAVSILENLNLQSVDSQQQSPLYSSIPSEIRNIIFHIALTEHESAGAQAHDFAVRHDHEPAPPPDISEQPSRVAPPTFAHPSRIIPQVRPNLQYRYPRLRDATRGFDWERPDGSVHMISDIALLLTCRKVYMETHALPLMLKEHTFYCFRGPGSWEKKTIPRYFLQTMDKPSPIRGLKQRDLIRSVRFFAQMFWLEDTESPYHFWPIVKDTDFLKPVENLHITIRRTDWWHWENNQKLKINPFRGNVNELTMQEDMALNHGNPPFRPKVWGLAFQHLPNLKSLRIDFETSQDQVDELQAIVDWAVRWKFPLSEARHLSTEGQQVELMSWRGRDYHRSDTCPECRVLSRTTNTGCASCDERSRLEPHGYGPRLYVWTLTWKPVKGELDNQLLET